MTFERRDYDVRIQRNGDIAITERWQVHFTGDAAQGATMDIYLGHTTGVDVQPVAGATAKSTQAHDFTDKQGRWVRQIAWEFPPAQNETRTFIIPYTVHGGLGINSSQAWLDYHFFDGPDHSSFPVNASRVAISLAAPASDAQVKATYPGAQPQTSRPDASTVVVAGQNLTSGQWLEALVVFPRASLDASVSRPAWQRSDTPPTPPTTIESDGSAVVGPSPSGSGNLLGALMRNFVLVLLVGLAIVGVLLFLVWRLTGRLQTRLADAGGGKSADVGADEEEPQYTTKPLPAIDLDFGEVEWPTRSEEFDVTAHGLHPLDPSDLEAIDAAVAAQRAKEQAESANGHQPQEEPDAAHEERRGADAVSGVGDGGS